MPALTLDLEVDAIAHPELHALLSGIENPAYRAERIRQLAVMGLVLERLRLLPEAVQAPAALNGFEAPVVASHLALVAPSVAPLTNPAPRPDAHNFPVLHEEVPESMLRHKTDAEPPALLEEVEATPSAPVPLAPLAATAHPEMSVDTAPVVHMPGNRSRLMRMKNRGLFTNE